VDVVKEVVQFTKGKGRASQKMTVAPSGQVSQVEWEYMLEKGNRKGQGSQKAMVAPPGRVGWKRQEAQGGLNMW
jgi:hypothetical protein